ncbi:MAG: glycosyltransferase family 2 protein [Steroidobacteraceae bacterium]|nr:glycosyltransferase family 2 protein [Steroidobacteraceae bacterium]
MLARNEADVIGHTLRWHFENGVEHAVVMDHASTDATPEILRGFGERVRVVNHTGNFNQAALTTELVRRCIKEFESDWIIPCDADEFWAGDFHAAIAGCDANILRVPTINFIAADVDDEFEPNPVLRMRYKIAHPPRIPKLPYILKPGQSKVMFATRGFRKIATGNHDVELASPRLSREHGLSISHYPLRSKAHFFEKVIQGGAALEVAGEHSKVGYHWRRWYAIYKAGKLEREWRMQSLSAWRLALMRGLGWVVRDRGMAERYRSFG